MHEIGIKELKNTASRVIEEVEAGERVVVTKRGRPTALILSMEDAEDFVLAAIGARQGTIVGIAWIHPLDVVRHHLGKRGHVAPTEGLIRTLGEAGVLFC